MKNWQCFLIVSVLFLLIGTESYEGKSYLNMVLSMMAFAGFITKAIVDICKEWERE